MLGGAGSFALDYTMHVRFGEDSDGSPVDGGASQLALLFSTYW
jgi:hypothetical protein